MAAILVADVVGYSSRMAKDEEGTFALVRQLMRDSVDPRIRQHDGRIVKTAGDGVIAEFASPVQAVQSAVSLQEALAAQAKNSAFGGLAMRIGINFGDVIVAPDGDVFGDGVNVAARLEQLASPGGICLSGKVHDEVRDKLPYAFVHQGEQQLKNIPRPIVVYTLFDVQPRAFPEASGSLAVPSKPLIVVRPLIGAGDVEPYFVAGFTEDLITELARFTQLTVASHSAATRLKDASLRALAQDSGVQFVVEGGIRRHGTRLRLSCQLVDATSENCLWAERFDRGEQELFELQDELVVIIIGTLVGRVKAAGADKARRKPPSNLAAYECVLRGNALPMGNVAAEAEARQWYERAAELDPTYGRAHAKLAHYLQLEWFRDMGPSDAQLEDAFEMAKKAVALAPNDPVCLNILGWIHLHRRDFTVAAQLYARTLELNPNDPEQVSYLGTFYTFAGEPDRALQWFERAQALDRFYDPAWYWPFRGLAHFVAHRFEPAIACLSRSTTMPVWVTAYLAAASALLARLDDSRGFTARTILADPTFSATRFAIKEPYRLDADRDTLLAGMRAAGLPG